MKEAADPVAPIPVAIDSELPESWRSLQDPPAVAAPVAQREPERAAPATPSVRPAEPPPVHPALNSSGRSFFTARTAALALAVVALAEAGLIARMYATRSRPVAVPSTAAAGFPLTIASSGIGDVVTVDGRDVGVAPYQLTVDSSVHEIRLTKPTPAATVPESPAAALKPRAAEEAVPVPVTRSGALRLSSAVEIQVLEGDRVLGSSAEGPIVTSAGVHMLELVNSALGYRERRAVEFKAGQTTTLVVTLPNGRVNVNAVPWAQVWIDGKDHGETPLANVSLPIGPHELILRHPQLGEQRQTVVVKAEALERVSVTMAR